MFAAEVGRRRLARDVHRRGKPERRIDGLAEGSEIPGAKRRRARIAAAKSRDRATHRARALVARRTRAMRVAVRRRASGTAALFSNREAAEVGKIERSLRGSIRKERSRGERAFTSRARENGKLRCLRPMEDALDRAHRATGHADAREAAVSVDRNVDSSRMQSRGGATCDRRRGVRG